MSVVVTTPHVPSCLLSRVGDDDWNQRTAEAHGLPSCTCAAPPSTKDLCGECLGGGCETCDGAGLLPVGHARSLPVLDAVWRRERGHA